MGGFFRSAPSSLASRSMKDHPQGPRGQEVRRIGFLRPTGGKMKVQLFPNSVLGDDKQMGCRVAGWRSGSGDHVDVSPSWGRSRNSVFSTFRSCLPARPKPTRFSTGPIGQSIMDRLPAKNLVGLSFLENGFRNLTNSKRPVHTAEGHGRLEDPGHAKPGLHRGLCRARHEPDASGVSRNCLRPSKRRRWTARKNPFRRHRQPEVLRGAEVSQQSRGHSYNPFMFMMGKKFWDKLSAEEKEIVRQAADETRPYQRAEKPQDRGRDARRTSGAWHGSRRGPGGSIGRHAEQDEAGLRTKFPKISARTSSPRCWAEVREGSAQASEWTQRPEALRAPSGMFQGKVPWLL